MLPLTVLTPTYNRAHTLHKCYESLLKQTNKNFKWLIIDDGSTDDTSSLVSKWIDKDIIKIEYFHKDNGGKHTALNMGFKYITSEYIIIVDSDDFLSDDAVETIIDSWEKYKNDETIASLVFLKANFENQLIGTQLSQYELVSNPIEYRYRYKIKGDKAETFKMKVLSNFLYPEINGEKFIGEGLVYNKIGKKFNSVYYNKVIYYCNYLSDGLTTAGRLLRIKNPEGGMLYHNEVQTPPTPLKFRIKHAMMYDIYGLFAKKKFKNVLYESSSKFNTIITFPFAYVIYLVWRYKYDSK